MSTTNGHAKALPPAAQEHSDSLSGVMGGRAPRMSAKKIRELVAELEVPFDPSGIEWRAVRTSKVNGQLRGQIVPYADSRAYIDRINALVTPAGWTRRYTVHSTANFHRSKDDKIAAKVFVTCDLTIFGLGSHSATGEEWADDENAGTSAEAQAFKRACACVGLGRYLYHFVGVWVDLDERKRPKIRPTLPAWATPEGWRQGMRPQPHVSSEQAVEDGSAENHHHENGQGKSGPTSEQSELIRQIESMAQPLGRRLYRGVLKGVRAWQPSDISDTAVLRKVLDTMQMGDQLVDRLASVLQQTGPEPLHKILRSLQVRSLEHVESIETLERIVRALESQ